MIDITAKHLNWSDFRELQRLSKIELHWLRFMTDDLEMASAVENQAQVQGYKVVYPYNLCEIEVMFIECSPSQLQQLETAARAWIAKVQREKEQDAKKQNRVLAIA